MRSPDRKNSGTRIQREREKPRLSQWPIRPSKLQAPHHLSDLISYCPSPPSVPLTSLLIFNYVMCTLALEPLFWLFSLPAKFSLDICLANLFTSFKSLLKSHLLYKAYPTTLLKMSIHIPSAMDTPDPLILLCFFFFFWLHWFFITAHRLCSCGTQAWLFHGMWALSFPTRDQIHVPCIGRWILNLWTTRKVPLFICL